MGARRTLLLGIGVMCLTRYRYAPPPRGLPCRILPLFVKRYERMDFGDRGVYSI